MEELYTNLVSLYNKAHHLHIRTVKMKGTATLHPTLWAHYESLQDMVDLFGEDIIQKSLNKDVPSPMECLKKATIETDVILDNAEEIIDELYKDYEYLKADLKKEAINAKDLLIQNILIDMWNKTAGFCADISREMCEEEEESKEIKNEIEKESKVIKMGIKAY